MKKLKRVLSVFLAIIMVMTSVAPVSAKAPALNKTQITLTVGKSTKLKVAGTNQKIKWSTSSKRTATVSSDGTVKGKKAGTAVITAKFDKKSLKCKVTVKAGLNRTTAVLAKNDYTTLTLNGAKAKGFRSSNTKVAKVSKNGKVTAVKKGKATITVTDTKNKKYTCKVTVEDPKLNKSSISLSAGKRYTLKLNGNTQKISWSSSNRKAATVSAKGKITAKSKGNTTVTAKVGRRTYKCRVKVTPGLNKTAVVLAKNDYTNLTLDGAKAKSFRSSNTKIAKVSKDGKVTAVKKGTATITATDTKNKKYTCKVTVEDPKLNKTAVSLTTGQKYTLKLEGNTQKISWSSSDKKVADENNKGEVTARSKGNAIITAKAGRRSFTCKVTVKVKVIATSTPTPIPAKKDWTVSFDAGNDTKIEKVTVKDGERVSRPSNPVKENYTFTGWYTDVDCTKSYDFEKRVRKDIELHAGWTEKTENADTYTRGEWMELLAAMVNMNLDVDPSSIDYAYADTEGTEYAVAIETAYAYGLLPNDVEDEIQDVPYFHPDDAATREFAGYTIAHAMGYETEETVAPKDWSDWDDITYKSEISRVVSADIMRLSDNAFNPQEPLNENDERLIESSVYQMIHSTKVEETEDNSVYTENVVKDELASATDYTVTDNGDGTYRVVITSNIRTIGVDAGETLVLPESTQYPAGIALKVVSVEKIGGQSIFNCVKPELEDVYQVIDFSGDATALPDQIEAADGVEVNYDPEGTIDSGADSGISTYAHIGGDGHTSLPGKLTFDLNKANFSEFLKLAGKIEVEIPDVTCILDADVGLLSGINVNEFTFSISEKVKIEETLTYTLAESGYELTNGNGNTRFEAGRIEIGRIPFAIGSTGLSLDLVLGFNISAKGSVSISYTIDAQEGFQYKNGQSRIIKNFSDSLDFLEIKGSASATLVFAAEISALEMFDLVGMTIDFGPAFEASFTPHVLATEAVYCSDVSIYATSTLALDSESAVGKFLEKVRHYTLEYQLLKNNAKNPLRRSLHVENGNIVNECKFGRCVLKGSVVSLKDNSVIAGARVQVYDEFGGLVRTRYTDASGEYSCDNLDEGKHKISISANNYKQYDMLVELTVNVTTYAETAKMVPRDLDMGTAQGKIIDAVTGRLISDTAYTVRKGWNVTAGESVASGTFASGEYEIGLETGNYTLYIEKDGYISNSINIAVQSNMCTVKDITLSPDNSGSLGGDKENIRIVLTWGEYPRDLDSHLFGPQYSGSDSYFRTCYWQKDYYYNGRLMANLDLDDTTSYGPETTTIYSAVDKGVYKFYVHDYTNDYSSDSTALSNSEAKVQIYVGNTLYYTFNVPTSKGGTVWHVFDYDAETDNVIPVNTLAYVGHGGDFPSLLSADIEVVEDEDSLLYEFCNLPAKEDITKVSDDGEVKADLEESEEDLDEFTAGEDSGESDILEKSEFSDEAETPEISEVTALPEETEAQAEVEFSADGN